MFRTPLVFKALRPGIYRNPSRKKMMTREIDMEPRTMSRIIKQDLEFRTFKRQTGQRLAVSLKANGK